MLLEISYWIHASSSEPIEACSTTFHATGAPVDGLRATVSEDRPYVVVTEFAGECGAWRDIHEVQNSLKHLATFDVTHPVSSDPCFIREFYTLLD